MPFGQHYRLFLEGSPDTFFAHDFAGRFVDVNRQACDSLGYTRDELLRMSVTDVDIAFDLAGAQAIWRTLEPGRTLTVLGRHRRQDGASFPVEVRLTCADVNGGKLFFGHARDISEREQHEQQQNRLTRLYHAISEISQLVVRIEEPAQMFERVCRVVVELGGMSLAWIGVKASDSDRIVPVSAFGEGTACLEGVVASASPDAVTGSGPAGAAYRELRHVIANNFLGDDVMSSRRELCVKYRLGSSAAFPIARGGKPFAVLNVYHEYPQAFDQEMVVLLDEVARDITFMLDNFDKETQRKNAEKTVLEQNNFLQAIFDSEPECVKVIAPQGNLLQMNRAGLEMLEVATVAEVNAIGLFEFIAPEFRNTFLDFHRHVCAGHSGHFEFRLKGRRGTERWLETHATPLRNADDQVIAHLGITRDVTEKKRFDQLIWQKANFDQLTGLPNRNMFQDRLQQELKKASRSGEMLAVLFIDLDRFKEVNDTLGHQIGDDLLVEVAQRIESCVRASDTVARLGGDEFMVLVSGLTDAEPVDVIADKINRTLAEPFLLGDRQSASHISASIGITLYPNDGDNVDQLLRNADQAMYVAKARGRDCFAWFTLTLREQTSQRMSLLQDLRNALSSGQLSLCFQPVIDLGSNRIVKLEALVRWQHPERGAVSPAEFIPLAEESGLILEIGNWVVFETVRWASHWKNRGVRDLQIGVNVSPVQLHRSDGRVGLLFEHLQALGLQGENLVMEITEGLLLHASAHISDLLATLRAQGVKLAIDDFGTGYSSLAYLKKFDIDYLKIDHSFIRDLETDPNDRALSEAIIVMAHKLGVKVIAEGVETQGQCDLLRAAGCDYAQGFLFFRPLPPEAIEALLCGATTPPLSAP